MVTVTAREELYSDGYDGIYYELAVMEADGWDAPLRVVNTPVEGFTLKRFAGTEDEEIYYAYPFRALWPAADPAQPFGGARFEINNVVAQDGSDEPVLLYVLRGIPSRARVRFMVVRSDAPDVVEMQTTRLRLTGIGYVESAITGTLEMPDFTGRRAGYRFTPDRYPNLRPG